MSRLAIQDRQAPVALKAVRPLRPKRELFRSRLALPESLRQGEQGLTALFAPAGYGKSTLMATWLDLLEADGVACCWVSLREKHADPKTLLSDLLEALQAQVPGLSCERSAINLRSATSYIVEPVLASLMQEIEANGQRITLFLDDLEKLSDSPGRDTVNLILEHRPDCLSLVVGGREARQLPLARLRLAGQLLELRLDELKFTSMEVAALLRERLDFEIDDDVLAGVMDITEGWPAAIGGYALGIAAGGNAGSLLEGFTHGTGGLADYLSEVVLQSHSAETQDLLMRAAVPDHFNLEMLAELLPEHDPAEALARIQEGSLFLQTVDNQGREYRFHSLCADFLRRRLQQTNPQLYKDLLQQVGDWCWAHGQQHEAVNYARAAEDWSLMADRISQLAESMVRGSGEFNTYLEWLRDLPVEVLKAHPQLFIHQAWALGFSRDMAQAQIALTRLQALLPAMPEEEAESYRRQMSLHHFLIEALMDRGHPLMPRMQQWLEDYADAPESEKGLLQGAISPSARNANQLDLSLSSLKEAERVYLSMGNDYSMSWVYNLGLSTLIKRGDFAEARIEGRKGLEVISNSLGDQSPAAGLSNAYLAYLTYEQGDVAASRKYLDCSMRFIANQGVVDALYFAHLTQSWLSADDGNDELSLGILLKGEQLGIEMGLPRLTMQLAMRRAMRYLMLGDQMAADAVIESRQLLDYPHDDFVEMREKCAELLQVNIELACGKFSEAQARAKALSKSVGTYGAQRMKAEYDFLQAIAMHNVGEVNEAARRLRELLSQAAVQERYRFMLHYGSLGRNLIAEQMKMRQQEWASGAQADAADRVLKRLAAAMKLDDETELGAQTGPVEGLTKREVDILKRAARTGLNNKKLAEALFVSEGTLKWHLHNIYSKLGARNRAGAIAQAQRIGLLG